jgi:phosphopantothenoylcysteine decarboxylase/phosphopantothenate--cysteine ligase
MGIAIANAAAQAGASVTLIAGQVKNLATLDSRILVTRVTSTNDMAQAVKHDFTDVDALVMAAAVADFQPITRADQKIKKNPDSDELTLRLRKTPDILKQVGQIKRHQFVVGFAAETQNLLQNANKKLIQKNADIIVANNVSNPGVGFGSDDNQVTILTRNHEPEKWPKMSKQLVAKKIIDLISDQIL